MADSLDIEMIRWAFRDEARVYESPSEAFRTTHSLCDELAQRSHAEGGLVGAQLALSDLRVALSSVRLSHPAFMPGTGPTAADSLKQVLEMTDWCLHQLATYLDVPSTPNA